MIRLFLLNPNFKDTNIDANQDYYCPHCAMIEGILAYYPEIRKKIDVRYVNFKRPRVQIIPYIGVENQGCPVLIVDKHEDKTLTHDFNAHGNYRFTNNKYDIADFLTTKFGVGKFHP